MKFKVDERVKVRTYRGKQPGIIKYIQGKGHYWLDVGMSQQGSFHECQIIKLKKWCQLDEPKPKSLWIHAHMINNLDSCEVMSKPRPNCDLIEFREVLK